MFFVISKIFWFVVEPATFLVLLGLLAVILIFSGFARTGRRLLIGLTLVFAFLVLTPVAVLFIRPLEERFPRPPADMPPPAGIIVLGGGLNGLLSQARDEPILVGGGSRLTTGVELARRYPQAPLIFTGGSASLIDFEPTEPVYVRKLWLGLGIPPERMIFEEKSRNTWENALFTWNLLKPKPGDRFILVTSASHMPRSVGIFRKVGFDVTPYPSDYRTAGDSRDWTVFLPAEDRLITLDLSLREWIGLVAYWFTGKTTALFPAP